MNYEIDLFGGKYYEAPDDAAIAKFVDCIKGMDQKGLLGKSFIEGMVMMSPIDPLVKWDILKSHLNEEDALPMKTRENLIKRNG